MRRVVMYLAVVALAVALVFVLRARKRAFVAAQVELLQSDDRTQAQEARKRLQRVGRSAVRPIIPLLQHKDEEVRARAALTLANIGHPAAAGPLLEAAKRGDFPAADALAFMKHPQASEARAWAYCRLGENTLEEFTQRLPLGGRPPTEPCVNWREPRAPFRPHSCQMIEWPASLFDAYAYGSLSIEDPRGADRPYRKAMQQTQLLEGIMGRARVRELCGEYQEAAEFYDQALAVAPGNKTAKVRKADAERLAALVRSMEELLPRDYRIERVLTHPTWREGSVSRHIGVASWAYRSYAVGSIAAKLVLFRDDGERLEKASVAPLFSLRELARAGYLPPAYVDVIRPDAKQPAAVVAIRTSLNRPRAWRRSRWTRRQWGPPHGTCDVLLYRVGKRGLLRTLQASSVAMPWVGDLDNDDAPEMVTWRPTTLNISPYPPLWPIVRAFVNGQYEDRTEQFPRLFEVVTSVLAEKEAQYPRDPKLADYLGRAYEILGKKEPALEGYRRAERKYRETAQRKMKKGDAEQARLHREAAAEVRARCLRLEGLGRSL